MVTEPSNTKSSQKALSLFPQPLGVRLLPSATLKGSAVAEVDSKLIYKFNLASWRVFLFLGFTALEAAAAWG